jgi:hypothetical protein
MAKGLIIGLILIIAIILVYRFTKPKPNTTRVNINNRNWNVISDFANKHEAAQLLARTNNTIIEFLRALKKKYHIDEPHFPDDQIARSTHYPNDIYNIVDALLDNYNPEVFYENDPRTSADTSYTVNKGDRMYICLRDKADPNQLVDENILLYVLLHEISHIANYAGWQHEALFWRVFKFILHEAVLANIYRPVDYSKYPVMYCSLLITYNPLYDDSLSNLWETA